MLLVVEVELKRKEMAVDGVKRGPTEFMYSQGLREEHIHGPLRT